jgi:hypothetical protein
MLQGNNRMFGRSIPGKSYSSAGAPSINKSSFKAKELAKAKKIRINKETSQRKKKESDIERRANDYCNYRGRGYVPNRRQVELCGAESAGDGSLNISGSGRNSVGPGKDVTDYLKRTRKRLSIVG